MADMKWIKLAINMHEDEKMKLINAMPGRDTIHYIWIRLLLLGGKLNADGEIFLSEGKPLTAKMLAILFSRPLQDIKLALKVLSSFEMIEIGTDKVIKIVNWNKHQNVEGMEKVRELNRKRAEDFREKKKLEKKAIGSKKTNEAEDLEDKKNSEKSQVSEENKELNKNETVEKLESNEEFSQNTSIDDKANTTNEVGSNTITETTDNDCCVNKNMSNVTQNDNNVTVTEQNKKENKKENKNKNKKKDIEKENANNLCDAQDKKLICDEEENKSNLFEQRNNKNKSPTCDENNKLVLEEKSQSSFLERHDNTKSESAEEEDINLKALELMHYHEKITGKVGGCDYVALRSAIEIHGDKWVKNAMDVGFEKNCTDIKYAIGVLKNWRRDGYPEDLKEVKTNGTRSTGKSDSADKNEFAGFKPKEPRKLTEEERRKMEANLI